MSIGGATIGATLTWLAIAVGALVVVAVVVIFRGRRRGSRTIALDVTHAASAWIAMVWLLFAVIRFGATLTTDQLAFVTDQVGLPAADLPCGVLRGGDPIPTGPHLTCVTSDAVFAEFEAVSLGARLTVASGALLTDLAIAAPLILIAVVSFQSIRGMPFARIVTRSLYVAAAVILIAGVAGGVLTPLGHVLTLNEAAPAGSAYAPSGVQLAVPLLPIGGALLCCALASIVQHGARIQKDTEGLV